MCPDELRRDPRSRRDRAAQPKEVLEAEEELDRAREEVERAASAYFGGAKGRGDEGAKAYHHALDREVEAARRHREVAAEPQKPRRPNPTSEARDERETA